MLSLIISFIMNGNSGKSGVIQVHAHKLLFLLSSSKWYFHLIPWILLEKEKHRMIPAYARDFQNVRILRISGQRLRKWLTGFFIVESASFLFLFLGPFSFCLRITRQNSDIASIIPDNDNIRNCMNYLQILFFIY